MKDKKDKPLKTRPKYYSVYIMRDGTVLYAKEKFILCNCDGSLHQQGIGCD